MVKFGSFTDVWFGLGLPVCWPGQREAIEFHHGWERQKIINGSAILAPWGDSGIKTSGIEALYFLYYLLQVCQACVHFVSVSAFIQLTWGTEQERVGEGMAVSLLLPVSQPAVTGTDFFSLEMKLSIHISFLYNMYHGCCSSLPRSQNTINHPEQSPGSCNKKVLKPQKGKPEEVSPQSRQISITQWKKKALVSIKDSTQKPASWGIPDFLGLCGLAR